MDNTRVVVTQPDYGMQINVYFVRELVDGFSVLTPSSEGKWEWFNYEEGAEPHPTLIIPRVLSNQGFVQMLVDALHSQLGVTATGTKNDALAEAKEEHLTDLRRLLFGADWIEIQKGEPIKPTGAEEWIMKGGEE